MDSSPVLRSALLALVVPFLSLQAAEEPTSEDFALRVLPAVIELPATPNEPAAVDLEVKLSSAVDAVQGWSYGVLLENSGLTTFFIENAWEHPDLSGIAGDAYTGGALESGRPSFNAINYFSPGDIVNAAGYARAPNMAMNGGVVEHDARDGLPGEWIAVIQGCVIDFIQQVALPIVDDFGLLALTVQVQGEAPNSGKVVFTDTIGAPPVAVTIVWSGHSFDPGAKGEDLYIPPAIQAPASISFRSVAPPSFMRGDVNGDGAYHIADAIAMLAFLFGDGAAPDCLKSADANDDGTVDIGDPVHMLGYLFGGGPLPREPFHACGSDPTPDELSCETVPLCE